MNATHRLAPGIASSLVALLVFGVKPHAVAASEFSDALTEPAADAPVETRTPLPAQRYARWKQSFVLTNNSLRVSVVPTIGRIMEIRPTGGDNLLRNDPKLLGRRPARHTTFTNFGGDWLWPVAQSHWTVLAGADWPPPPVLADGAWHAEAWRHADGSSSCQLKRKYGAPLNLIVTRLVTLDATAPRIRIEQRALCVGATKVPVTLWNISQVGAAEHVFLPADPALPEGIRALMGGLPPATHLRRQGDVLVFAARAGGEYKFGGQPTNAWVAAQRGTTVLVERETNRIDGPRPDGGCAIEVYANAGLGYTEIETLSPERLLQPGESIENVLVIQCLPQDPRGSFDASEMLVPERHPSALQ